MRPLEHGQPTSECCFADLPGSDQRDARESRQPLHQRTFQQSRDHPRNYGSQVLICKELQTAYRPSAIMANLGPCLRSRRPRWRAAHPPACCAVGAGARSVLAAGVAPALASQRACSAPAPASCALRSRCPDSTGEPVEAPRPSWTGLHVPQRFKFRRIRPRLRPTAWGWVGRMAFMSQVGLFEVYP